eukprot:TRINITY_DN1980_c0_g1_i1.p1 TRINITY_DN1980_c0_g1~~TRINITY_DN1980_c0_g1_i1.p1  ORF type:complete len:323 (+),score=141.50 TRINITY_DN1980_c0_g1_i1:111-971(+)
MKASLVVLCVLGLVCAALADYPCQPQTGQVYAGLYAAGGGSSASGKPVYFTFSNDGRHSVSENDETGTIFTEWHIDGGELAVRDLASFPLDGNCDSDLVGVYKTEYTENCFELKLSLVEDTCRERAVLYDGLVVRNARKLSNDYCGIFPDQVYTGNYPIRQNNEFSQFPVTFVFAHDGETVIEHSEYNTFFSRWVTTTDRATIYDLGSNPATNVCNPSVAGEYTIRYALDCSFLKLVLRSDSCTSRAEQLDGLTLFRKNDFEIIAGAGSLTAALFATIALVMAFLF